MFKKSKYFLIVDSVENAIKFYAEKLLFTVTEVGMENTSTPFMSYAEMRRGKCHIIVRVPALPELAEFSMVRRINSRAAGMFLEIKENIEEFFEGCKKKKFNIMTEITKHPKGYVFFQIADPFGSRIHFYQQTDEPVAASEKSNICGLAVEPAELSEIAKGGTPLRLSNHMKNLGMSRRVAKKFIKAWHLKYHSKK